MKPSDSGRCFACGPNNPRGLRLQFRSEGEAYVTEFTPEPDHQGFSGIAHGGIVATLLDEAMARNLWIRDIPALTAEMRISLHHPTRIGERLTISGRITRQSGRLILCEAEARRPDGTVAATAEGKFLRAKEGKEQQA